MTTPFRKHVVITGTGRSGTTFLVELLTALKLDTGFASEAALNKKRHHSRAGLELDIKQDNCPYIVKSPWFCDHSNEVIHRDDIKIEHIFIPIRDLNAAAESRRFVRRTALSKMTFLAKLKAIAKRKEFDGGLVHTSSMKPGEQEEILLKQLYSLLLNVSKVDIPITLMQYPRLTNDCRYLYKKLEPVLNNITFTDFSEAFNRTAQPELVHTFNSNDS